MNRLIAVLALLLLSACLPIPQINNNLDLPAIDYRHSPLTVQSEYVEIAGFDEINTPAQYDKATYTRYFFPEDNSETALILVPGIFAGSADLGIIARQLVAAIPNFEVWVIDRRANLLEDRSQFQKAIENRNPEIAYNYYIKNYNEENGYKPLNSEDASFISHWTLDVHLQDIHQIVLLAQKKFEKVVLGGHSLGASIIGYYAAYDFATIGSDPGYTHLDGLFLIDGVLGRTGGFDLSPEGLSLGIWEILPSENSLKAESGIPYLPGLEYYYLETEMLQLYAHFLPNSIAKAEFSSFPISNRAALGVSIDDNYRESIVFSSSVGSALGAEFSGNIAAILLGDIEGVYSQSVVGLAEGSDKVTWLNNENTDIDNIAKTSSTMLANKSEWYFPLRLMLDIAKYDIALEHTQNYVPNREVTTPTLAIGAARGLVRSLDGFSAYSNTRLNSQFSLYIVPNFTHLDMIQADDNPVVALFKIWLERLN